MIKDDIIKYLTLLNEKLKQKRVKGEICLYGGAVMCLVYDARPSTKDVDAVFQPAQIIRKAAGEIAEEEDIYPDWLNDGVKGFLTEHSRKVFMSLSNLIIMTADPDYMFAMKTLALRVDSADKDDIIFLIKELNITSIDKAFDIILKYYPQQQVKPAVRFFLEEIFNGI